MQFLPLVAESTGGWGPTGAKTLCRIAKHAAAKQGTETNDSLARCYEGLNVIRAHGQAVLRRAQGASEDAVAGPRDSAAVVAGALFEDSVGAMQLQ